MKTALLEIIKTCEDFQNMDTEGTEVAEQCDDGYRTICKVITIASGMLAEIEARQTTPINDGGPAFPFHIECPSSGPETYYGMTLRDYFAAKVLQGLIGKLSQEEIDEKGALLMHKILAITSYNIADAMIERRNK